MKCAKPGQNLMKWIIVSISTIILISSVGEPAMAQGLRNNVIDIDDHLNLDLKLSTRFEEFEAQHVRNEIDSTAASGNGNGFIEPEEIEAYELHSVEEALNLARHISIDDKSAFVHAYDVEISNAGIDAYSKDPIFKNLSLSLSWPEVNINVSEHKFVKSGAEPLINIQISFGKEWRIIKYTGISNSTLSKDQRIVKGFEWPGYLTVVDFEKFEDEDEWKLTPGYFLGSLIIAMVIVIVIIYYRRK